MSEFLSAALTRLLEIFKPEQVCWICLVLTIGGITYGVNTFAAADEVAQLSARMDEQRAFDLRAEQCRAIKEGRNASRYTLEMQQVLRRYQETTGSYYRVPDCAELM